MGSQRADLDHDRWLAHHDVSLPLGWKQTIRNERAGEIGWSGLAFCQWYKRVCAGVEVEYLARVALRFFALVSPLAVAVPLDRE